MAWFAPATVVVGQVMTAAFWNSQVRDNFGDLDARTRVTAGFQNLNQTRASLAFGDLATVGPAVTVITGGVAVVALHCTLGNNTVNNGATMSVAVSGASTVAPGVHEISHVSNPANSGEGQSGVFVFTGLVAGSNVFTAKYRADVGGTAFFHSRRIAVWPASPLA